MNDTKETKRLHPVNLTVPLDPRELHEIDEAARCALLQTGPDWHANCDEYVEDISFRVEYLNFVLARGMSDFVSHHVAKSQPSTVRRMIEMIKRLKAEAATLTRQRDEARVLAARAGRAIEAARLARLQLHADDPERATLFLDEVHKVLDDYERDLRGRVLPFKEVDCG